MKNTLTEPDRELLKLVGIDTCGASEASVLLAKLRELLRIITKAADIRIAVATGGSLDRRALQRAGLEALFDKLVDPQGQRSRSRFDSPERLRTLVILLEIQNGELRRINQHLRRRCDEYWRNAHEGVPQYRCLQYYAARTPEDRAEVERQTQKDRLDYKARKAREGAEERKQVQTRMRSQMRDKAATSAPVDWFAPMPVSNLREPLGYVQATAVNRKKINAFLRSIEATALPPCRSGRRGRPLPLYDFDSNLKVLEQWLSVWLGEDSNRIANELLNALLWCAGREESAEQARGFREVLRNLLSRIETGITDEDLRQEIKAYGAALVSEAVWLRLATAAQQARLRAEQKSQSEVLPRDFLTDLLIGGSTT